FRKDHAPTKSWSEMTMRRKVISLQCRGNRSPESKSMRRTAFVRDHSASLSTLALLGEDSPGSWPQGPELALGRNPGMDTASQAHPDDGWLSAHSHSSDRSGVLLRHTAHCSGHREAGRLAAALSKGTERSRQGFRLVDREGLLHERRMPHGRQHGGKNPASA